PPDRRYLATAASGPSARIGIAAGTRRDSASFNPSRAHGFATTTPSSGLNRAWIVGRTTKPTHTAPASHSAIRHRELRGDPVGNRIGRTTKTLTRAGNQVHSDNQAPARVRDDREPVRTISVPKNVADHNRAKPINTHPIVVRGRRRPMGGPSPARTTDATA